MSMEYGIHQTKMEVKAPAKVQVVDTKTPGLQGSLQLVLIYSIWLIRYFVSINFF